MEKIVLKVGDVLPLPLSRSEVAPVAGGLDTAADLIISASDSGLIHPDVHMSVNVTAEGATASVRAPLDETKVLLDKKLERIDDLLSLSTVLSANAVWRQEVVEKLRKEEADLVARLQGKYLNNLVFFCFLKQKNVRTRRR